MANVKAATILATQVPIPTMIVAARVPTPIMTVPANHVERPKKFSGLNFKRWQQKMMFYLTTLSEVLD